VDVSYQTNFFKECILLLKGKSTILCSLSSIECKQKTQLTELHMMNNQCLENG